MEKNELYDLARLIENREGLGSDFSKVMDLFRDTLQKKYVSKIHAAANAQEEAVVEHPPKEVTLLRAMRAFTDESKQEQMDQMIQMLLFMNTAKHVNETVSELTKGNNQMLQTMSSEGNPPEKPELSESSTKIAGLLLTLALAKII